MKTSIISIVLSTAGLTLGAPSKDTKKRASSFEWFGSNESGAEFGSGNIPGVEGTDYTFPNTTAIQILIDAGMNIFRVPFLMERMIPTEMTGSLNTAYFEGYSEVINYITGQGAHAVVDPHNFGRYYGTPISSTSDFQTFWSTLASQFKSNDKVIFDTNNEYHDMDESVVVALNQAAIDGIRDAGATTQYIFVEGNSYTGAWTWTTYNTAMVNLTDPSGLIVYEMHQYLDSDGSGTSDQCVSSTIGQERVVDATTWLQTNGKRGILGEFAGGANSVCEEAVKGMLNYLEQNSGVWLGASWWSAGPWWGDYIFSMEPPSGTAYVNYLSILESYFP
ncbi:putative endo-beta-1,4-glucanase B [Talaromyces pinophilus]|nr:putative endo-beta-1,4-glucanase B [Talaromyces pinophilus]